MRTSSMLASLAALAASSLALAAPTHALTETWRVTASSDSIALSTNSPVQQAIDPASGDIYVVANAVHGTSIVIAIEKRAPDGMPLWYVEHDVVGERTFVVDVTLDRDGDLWVLAESRTQDPITNLVVTHGVVLVKVASATGEILLDLLDAEPARQVHAPTAIAIDAAGRVVVASWHLTSNTPIVGKVRVLDLDGVEQWASTSTGYRPFRLAASPNGEIYAAGQSTSQVTYAIARYAPNGSLLWLKTADNPGYDDRLDRVVADSAGDVIATGQSGTQSFTVKLRRQNGKLVWKRLLPHGRVTFTPSEEVGLRLHPSGDVIIASGYDQVTVSRLANGNGTVLWSIAPPVGGFAALAIDAAGNPVLSSASDGARVSILAGTNGLIMAAAHTPEVDEYNALGVDPISGAIAASGHFRTPEKFIAISASYE